MSEKRHDLEQCDIKKFVMRYMLAYVVTLLNLLGLCNSARLNSLIMALLVVLAGFLFIFSLSLFVEELDIFEKVRLVLSHKWYYLAIVALVITAVLCFSL